ncbi:MAG TPA: ATP synthase F1 subunit epsilon [Candidatus Limnocylindrales bacterium]|nr:ATP synthase F1 subunit epsilon [Candidatus Limnocylindrales bacterium]
MQLEIITPDKTIFKGEVDSATFPGVMGAFQVLHNHAPIVSILQEGKVVLKANNTKKEIQILGGVVEVLKNKIIVLAEGVKEF